MRLAVDGRELFQPYGMGRLLFQTILGLRRQFPQTKITVFLHRDKSRLLSLFGELAESDRLSFACCPLSLSPLVWENYFLRPNLTPQNFDLFYLPHNQTGILDLKIPMVALICDIIPLKFPQYYSEVERTSRGLRNAGRLSAKIVTISDCSKKDLQAYLGVAAEKIEVSYPGLGEFYTPRREAEVNQRVLTKFGLTKPYLLNVGGFDPRKNLALLLKSFAKYLRESGDELRLAVVGPLKALPIFRNYENPLQLARELGLGERVIFTDTVSEPELLSLYQEAAALVYPSLYEGFGLPAAEALACGTPVVAAAGSSIEEAVNGQALFFPATDERALIDCLKKLRAGGEWLTGQTRSGQEWTSRLTPERWVAALHKIFERVAGRC